MQNAPYVEKKADQLGATDTHHISRAAFSLRIKKSRPRYTTAHQRRILQAFADRWSRRRGCQAGNIETSFVDSTPDRIFVSWRAILRSDYTEFSRKDIDAGHPIRVPVMLRAAAL